MGIIGFLGLLDIEHFSMIEWHFKRIGWAADGTPYTPY